MLHQQQRVSTTRQELLCSFAAKQGGAPQPICSPRLRCVSWVRLPHASLSVPLMSLPCNTSFFSPHACN